MKHRTPKPSPSKQRGGAKVAQATVAPLRDHDTEIVGKQSLGALEAEWLQFHKRHCEDKPPANAIDAMRYGKLVGTTDRTAFMRLKSLADAGVLDSGIFKVKDSTSNRLRPVRFFWPRKGKCLAAKK